MALTWSTQSVKYFNENPDELWSVFYKGTPDEYTDLNGITKSIVFGTMAVGVGNIDWDHAPDFYARWKTLEEFDHFYLYQKGTEIHYLQISDVVKHKGLFTNVSFEPEKEWCIRSVDFLNRYPKEGRDKVTAADLSKFIRSKKKEFKESVQWA